MNGNVQTMKLMSLHTVIMESEINIKSKGMCRKT